MCDTVRTDRTAACSSGGAFWQGSGYCKCNTAGFLRNGPRFVGFGSGWSEADGHGFPGFGV